MSTRKTHEAQLPGALVQMMVVTINGTNYALFGPVVFPPDGPPEQELDITEFHFGEILPAHVAADLLRGSHVRELGTEVQ